MSALDPARRGSLAAMLEERARLLALKPMLIEEALARCHPRTASVKGGSARSARSGRAATGSIAAPVLEASAPGEGRPPTAALARAAASTSDGILEENATARTVADSLPQGQQGQQVTTGDLIPPGCIVAGYRIEGMLGKGGMGQVYRALQLSVQRPVAFKVLTRRLAADPSFRDRFLREARAAGRLHHHHLITVHDVGEADGLMFFSMELVEGGTVRDLIARGPISSERAIDIAIQALSALSYAHQHGIVHRDIKPDNLMVTPAGVVKVADLGLSLISDSGSRALDSTQAGTLMGTPHYMPPEQTRNAHTVDERSDLYALGATLYHMVLGHPPFTGKNPVEVVMKAATEPLSFPESMQDPELREVLERLLAKRPEDRYPSAMAAIAALEQLQGPGPGQRPGRTQRRRALRVRRLRRLHPARALAVSGALLSALVVLWICLPHPHHLDAGERQRIAELIDQEQYPQALERISDDLALQRGGTLAFSELQMLHAQAAGAWDRSSTDRVSAAFRRYNDAVAAHDLKAAGMALSLDDESTLAPEARSRLEKQRVSFEAQLTELADASSGHSDDPETEAAHNRERQAFLAGVLWGRFRPDKDAEVQPIDGGITFGASGKGWVNLAPFSERLPLTKLLKGGLRLECTFASEQAGTQIQLTLLGARVVVTPGRLVLSIAAQERARAPSGTPVRVRYRNHQLEVALGAGEWMIAGPVGTGFTPIAFAWQLGALGKAQMVSSFEKS